MYRVCVRVCMCARVCVYVCARMYIGIVLNKIFEFILWGLMNVSVKFVGY